MQYIHIYPYKINWRKLKDTSIIYNFHQKAVFKYLTTHGLRKPDRVLYCDQLVSSWRLIMKSFNLVSKRFHALFQHKNETTIPIKLSTQSLSTKQCKQMMSSLIFLQDIISPYLNYLPIAKILWVHCTKMWFQFCKVIIHWLIKCSKAD
mgnify:CR=1 FL=1